MKWLKQSVELYKTNFRLSLYVAVFSLGTLVLSSLFNIIGVWLASICLIYLQGFLFLNLSGHSLKFYEIKKIPGTRSLFILSLVMVPTNMMMGALLGLLQGSDSIRMAITLSLIFSLVCSYIYILIFHSVGFIVLRGLSFRWALDASLKGSKENRLQIGGLGLLIILILGLGALPLGVGLVIALPLAFYLYYFSFRDLYPEPTKSSVDQPLP